MSKRMANILLSTQALALVAALVIAGCGLTPEQKLQQGFNTVTASANMATRLLDTHVISSAQAERIYTVGVVADQSLKSGEQRLIECRARGETDCAFAVSEIDMGAGLLTELEKFLEAQQLNGGP